MSDRVPPSSHRLRQMASDYEKAVSETRSEQMAARAVARARGTEPLRRRIVAVAAGFSVVALVFVALGAASSSSLPGDALYGVNRAYESIGARVGFVDPVERRLNEVIALADRGDAVRAVQVAEEALAGLERAGFEVSLPLGTTTTTVDDPDDGNATQSTTPPKVTVEATPGDGPEERINTLRLAAQLLLSNVKDHGEDLESAAVGLAKAVSDLGNEVPPPVEASTTTTVVAESTTTTLIDDTTTTIVDETTTTTVPGSSTTTSVNAGGGSGDGEGPIFLPPSP